MTLTLKELVPTDEMTADQKRESREERSAAFGIEIVASSALSFPGDGPRDLDLYGDPVNFKFALAYPEQSEPDKARSANARVRFKQFATQIYAREASMAVVHARIVEAELEAGVAPAIDPDDPLDALLPEELRARAMSAATKAAIQGTEALVRRAEAAYEARFAAPSRVA